MLESFRSIDAEPRINISREHKKRSIKYTIHTCSSDVPIQLEKKFNPSLQTILQGSSVLKDFWKITFLPPTN